MVTDVAVGEGAMVSGFKLPRTIQYSIMTYAKCTTAEPITIK